MMQRLVIWTSILLVLNTDVFAEQERTAQSARTCKELLSLISTSAVPPVPQPRGFVLAAVTIPETSSRSAYEIRFDEGAPIVTSDLGQAIAAAVSRNSDGQPVYFDVSGLPAIRQVAFEKSLEIAAANRDIRTRVVKDLGALGDPAQPLKDVVVRGTVEEGTGKRAGLFSQSADATIGTRKFAVRVTSRLKQVVTKFFQRLKAALLKKKSGRTTISIVNEIRADLAREHRLSEDEIIVEFSDQLGKTVLVQSEGNVR